MPVSLQETWAIVVTLLAEMAGLLARTPLSGVQKPFILFLNRLPTFFDDFLIFVSSS